MTTGLRSDASGTFGALTFGGDDAVTFDADGIQAGSYKPGSIAADDFADGALIEDAPVGIGYGPGAGGTVTQATSKSTAVTLNKPSGQITMNAASLAAGASVTFLLNSTSINYTDVLSVALVIGVGGYSNYRITATCLTGAAAITVWNVTGASLSEAVVLQYVLHKGAVS